MGKLAKFAQIKTFSNVFEFPAAKRGKWRDGFRDETFVSAELACGKGEYTLHLAQQFPDNVYIGMDIKGDRLFSGAKKALDCSLKNVAFVRGFIDHLPQYFAPNELSEIWLTFPDPFVKTRKMKRRLTHPKFLHLYQRCLTANGRIHLKTDDARLFDFTCSVLGLYGKNPLHSFVYDDTSTRDFPDQRVYISTTYERKNLSGSGRNFYVCFTVDGIDFTRPVDLSSLK